MSGEEYKRRLKAIMEKIANEYEEKGTPKEELVKKYEPEYFALNEEGAVAWKKNMHLTMGNVSRAISKHCSERIIEEENKRLQEEIDKLADDGFSAKQISEKVGCSVSKVYSLHPIFTGKKPPTRDTNEGVYPCDIEEVKKTLKEGDVIKLNLLHEMVTQGGKLSIFYRPERVKVNMVCKHFIDTNFGCLKYSDVIVGMRGVSNG